MELTKRVGAAFAALALAVVLLPAPSSRASEDAPAKLQHRLAVNGAAAPSLAREAANPGNEAAPDSLARRRRQDRAPIHPGECRMASSAGIALRCLSGSLDPEGAQRNLRMITVETRVGENTSILIRVPVDITAR